VFIDVNSIEPGTDFQEAIRRAVASADALVVVIGPSWTQELDQNGHRRLEDPGCKPAFLEPGCHLPDPFSTHTT
jgi:hypothetical protein